MFSPVHGTVSSHYKTPSRPFHEGIDIACPENTPVYAAFAGTVVRVVSNRVHDRSSSQTRNSGKPELAPYRTPNGVIIQNPDKEKQLYGHVKPVVKVGQKVAKGQLLGYVDLSGNTTGYHLHFETWNTRGVTYDPMLAFRNHKVTPGSKMTPPTIKPAASTTTTKKTTTSKDKLPSNKTIQTRLNKMGLYRGIIDGVNGNMQKSAVTAYQRGNGLVPDGVWGRKTENKYKGNVRIQQALNRMRRGTIAVDGHMPKGGKTRQHIVYLKQRNGIKPANEAFNTAFKNFLIKVGAWK